MLIGGHVSTAGGLDKAVARGVEIRADAIQVFNQSPRMWRPTRYGAEDFESFRQAIEPSRVDAVVIHAVYLINCATVEADKRQKSLASLVHALRVGEAIDAAGVVLHAGSRVGAEAEDAIERACATIAEALAETEGCRLLLENTAGTDGPLGRDPAELAALIEGAGGDERLGLCLDSCHLFASGRDVRDAGELAALLDELDRAIGLHRLTCLHLNDSAVGLGANRDRHANLGEGEIGRKGIATFLSEPRFEGLPVLLEVPGPERKGPDRKQIALARRLRGEGLARRAS